MPERTGGVQAYLFFSTGGDGASREFRRRGKVFSCFSWKIFDWPDALFRCVHARNHFSDNESEGGCGTLAHATCTGPESRDFVVGFVERKAWRSEKSRRQWTVR